MARASSVSEVPGKRRSPDTSNGEAVGRTQDEPTTGRVLEDSARGQSKRANGGGLKPAFLGWSKTRTNGTSTSTSSPEPSTIPTPPPAPSVAKLAPAAAVLEWHPVTDSSPGAPPGVTAVTHAVEIRERTAASTERSGNGNGNANGNGNSCGDDPDAGWGPWRAAEHEPIEEGEAGVPVVCRVLDLRPGVHHAVRYLTSCAPPGDTTHPLIPPSVPVEFETPPTPPGAPQPPALASRSKDTLNLRWKLPADDGGRPVTEFRVACSPPPSKAEMERTGARLFDAAERDAVPLPGGDGGGPGRGPWDDAEWALVYSGGLDVRLKLAGLIPGSRYAFKLRAVNVAGSSRWSEECGFNTSPVPPAPPPSMLVTLATAESVLLAWRQPDCRGSSVGEYEVEMSVDGRPGTFTRVYSGELRTAEVTGLHPGRCYLFRVRAKNDAGWGGFSTPLTPATTGAMPPGPPASAPVPVVYAADSAGSEGMLVGESRRKRNPTRHSVALAWSTPADDGGSPIFGYNVEMRGGGLLDWKKVCTLGRRPKKLQDKDNKGAKVDTGVGAETGGNGVFCELSPPPAAVVSGLAAGCKYAVRVCARNAAGVGPFSQVGEFTSAPGPPMHPGQPTVVDRKDTSLTISWPVPEHDGGSPVTGYYLKFATVNHFPIDGAPKEEVHSIYAGTGMSCSLIDLAPSTEYVVRVEAVNAEGSSPWSAAVTARTRPARPVPPDAPNATSITARRVRLEWVPPADRGASIKSYVVERRAVGPVRAPEGDGRVSGHINCHDDGGYMNGHAREGYDNGHGEAATDGPTDMSDDPCNGAAGDFEIVHEGGTCQATVEGLRPDFRYEFRVIAVNSIGASPASLVTTVVTEPAAPGAPGVPTSAVGKSPKSDTVYVSWQPPKELNDHRPIVEYVLEAVQPSTATSVVGVGGGSKKKGKSKGPRGSGAGEGCDGKEADAWRVVYRGQELSAVVSGLDPGTLVCLRVCAVNLSGPGPFSQPRTFTTQALPPAAPEPPTFSQLQPDSVKVRWMPPTVLNGSVVARYRVQMRQAAAAVAGEASGWTTAFTGATATALSFKATRLRPATRYAFRVVADAEEDRGEKIGPGVFSVAATVTTPHRPPIAPPPPEFVTATTRSITVAWRVGECKADEGTEITARFALEVAGLEPGGGFVTVHECDAFVIAEGGGDAVSPSTADDSSVRGDRCDEGDIKRNDSGDEGLGGAVGVDDPGSEDTTLPPSVPAPPIERYTVSGLRPGQHIRARVRAIGNHGGSSTGVPVGMRTNSPPAGPCSSSASSASSLEECGAGVSHGAGVKGGKVLDSSSPVGGAAPRPCVGLSRKGGVKASVTSSFPSTSHASAPSKSLAGVKPLGSRQKAAAQARYKRRVQRYAVVAVMVFLALLVVLLAIGDHRKPRFRMRPQKVS